MLSDGACSISVPVRPLVSGCHRLPALQIVRQQHEGSLTYLLTYFLSFNAFVFIVFAIDVRYIRIW